MPEARHCLVHPPDRRVPPPQYSGKDGSFRMARKARKVTGGVDTHGEAHHAAVVDALGRQLANHEFPTTPRGYRALLSWLPVSGSWSGSGWKALAPMVRR